MSINNQELRTLSGLTSIKADQLELPKSRRGISLNGDYGVAGQTIQKDENNKLKWGFIDDIEIPDGSIGGEKLKSNITITTTGNISATDITATNYFNQTNEDAVNTFAGELIVPKLETTNTREEAIRVRNGGIVNIYEDDGGSPDPDLLISLSGVNGQVRAVELRTDNIIIDRVDEVMILDSNGIQITGNRDIAAGGSYFVGSNFLITGQHGATTGLIEGDLIITNNPVGENPQSGNLDVKLGHAYFRGGTDFIGNSNVDFIDSLSQLYLRISPTAQKIILNGEYESSKIGATPPPTDNTYTDWALDLTTTNSHAHIGGNLIIDGTIYGNVEGTITEEEVDCQRLTIRTATPPISGLTGIILGSGSEITNDTSGINELTIDADTSDIICNTLTTKGNTNIGSTGASITKIGSSSANDELNVETTTINLGSSTGSLTNIRTTIRGGETRINGDRVIINQVPQGTTPPAGTSLEGGAGVQADNTYRNDVKYFNLNGRYLSHNLAGTTQQHRIYRASTEKGVEVSSVPGFSGTTSTGYLQPIGFSIADVVAPTSVAKITIQSYYRHIKGNPDLYCRIDETATGATPYTAQIGGPRIIKNSINLSGAETQHKYDFVLTGLLEGDTYSCYPKYAHTTEGRGFLCYGGAFGEMYMYLEWLESYYGDVSDPYPPIAPSQEILGEELQSYSYIDNETQNYTRIYNTSNKWLFDGSQDVGTDTLEAHFTARGTTGYLEFGFYANTLTAGMIFHIGVASATGGTSPFSTTLTSSAVSIDAYKQGLFNGDTTRYSLKEILDFTSYENTYITSKFHFHNLTIGTEYKMALYGRCNYTGSIYVNAGGKSTSGTADRSAHQPVFLKFYHYDDSIGGARTDDAYVPPPEPEPEGDDY